MIDTVKMTKKRNELNKLRTDIIDVYKQLMKHMCKKHRDIDGDTIRLEIMDSIMHHVMQKTKLRLKRKVRSKTVKVPVYIDPSKSQQAEECSFLP